MSDHLSTKACREHFVMKNGSLYKRLKDGTERRISSLQQGRVRTVLYGQVYFGVDLAWTLYYGTTPAFPVFTLDGDPFNLSMENLMAARIKRLRLRIKEVTGGFRHCLSKHMTFNTYERCRDDWVHQARKYYEADMINIRAWEDQYLADPAAQVDYVRPVRASHARGRAASGDRPEPPQHRDGYRHYWYENQWVVVPEAVHVSDDYIERCRRVLAGAVAFRFNPDIEQTEGFDAAGVLVP